MALQITLASWARRDGLDGGPHLPHRCLAFALILTTTEPR